MLFGAFPKSLFNVSKFYEEKTRNFVLSPIGQISEADNLSQALQ